MSITEDDWEAFMGHFKATLDEFSVPKTERGEVIAFIESPKDDIVDK